MKEKSGGAMSLRNSPTLTPALLASNRRNAKKSTGPRTAQGKAWSRLNRLREGWQSAEYRNFLLALLHAPPGRVEETAQALLSSQTGASPSVCGDSEVGCPNGSRYIQHIQRTTVDARAEKRVAQPLPNLSSCRKRTMSTRIPTIY